MKRAARVPRREPRTRMQLTAADVAVCVLLVLTAAGVAVQATGLTGMARLVMVVATGLSLVIGFWRLRVWAAVLGITIVTGGGAAAAYALRGTGTKTLWIVVGALIVAALGLIGVWASGQLGRVYRRLRDHRRAIEALTQIDPATGVFKPNAGRDRLRAEITRAVRYRRVFTLIVGKPVDWESEVARRGMDSAQELFTEMLRSATTVLRNNDIIASEPDYAFIVILPETTAAGGEVAAQHIQEAVQGILAVRFGLVQCPDDGQTEESLMREARQALGFAEMANLPIVSRNALIEDK